MALAKNAAIDPTTLGSNDLMAIYMADRQADAEWKQAMEATLRSLHGRPPTAPAAIAAPAAPAVDDAWKQATDARIRALQGNRDQIAAAAGKWVTKDDMMYAAGGAAVGGGIAYLGTTQGWWEMTPVTMGLGLGGGAVAGYAVSRLLRQG